MGLRGKNRHLTSGSGDGQIDIYNNLSFLSPSLSSPSLPSPRLIPPPPPPPPPHTPLCFYFFLVSLPFAAMAGCLEASYQKYGCKSVKQATLASEDDKLAGTAK